MCFEKNLEKYAELLVKSGVNLKQGQILLIQAHLTAADLVRKVAEYAYKHGAKEVVVTWNDDTLNRLKYDYAPMSQFEKLPEWRIAFSNEYALEGAASLSIATPNPDAMAGADHRKTAALAKASHDACSAARACKDKVMSSWCIAPAASVTWAKKVFPGETEEKAMELLWDAIFKANRVDTPDPSEAWKQHHESFQSRIQYLNSLQLDHLHYTNSLGTDLTLGMPENHCWGGGAAKTADGIYFFSNMPTEEIYATPHKDRADGIVYSSRTLNYHGTLIDKFWLKFEKGCIVDFGAETGYEKLKALIETDEGARHLGEVALVPTNSPISEMGLLFYSILFDENASCHCAIGNGFTSAFKGGRDSTREELAARGLNESAVHVDFMLGTPDLSITGYTKDGKEYPIFRDGNWAF